MTALAPGILVGLTGVLSAWLLRRLFDPIPLRVLAFFAVVVCSLFWQVLFAGAVLLPLDDLPVDPPYQGLPHSGTPSFSLQADLLEDFTPYYSQLRRSYRRLELPFYNQLVGAGEPFLVNTQVQHFHPLVLLTLILPLEQAVGAMSALKVLQALFFTFLFCRKIGQSEPAALAAALVYGLSGFLMMWLGWPHAHSAAALPMILYAVERVLEARSRAGASSGIPAETIRRRRDPILLVVSLLFLLTGGHPETIFYVGATVAVYSLVRLASLERRPRARVRRALDLLFPAMVAAGLCGFFLIPTALYLPNAARYQDVENRRAVAMSPWQAIYDTVTDSSRRQDALDAMSQRVVPVVAPFAFGRFGMSYWGGDNTIEDNAAFAGTLALFLALLALWPRRDRLPGERVWIALGGLALLLIIRPPGLMELLGWLPAVGHSASLHRRTAMLLLFAIAVLAGATVHRGLGSRRFGVAATLLGLALGTLVVHTYLAYPDPKQHLGLAELRNWTQTIQVGAVVLGAVVLWTGRKWPRINWLLSLLIAFELIFVFGRFHPPMPRSLYYPNVPSIDYLSENLGHQRFVGLRRTFRYNVAMLYGLADLRSGSPLQPAAFRRLTESLRWRPDPRQFEVAEHPLYDLLGVRYVMTEPGVEVPALQRVFEGGGWIYERPQPLPFLYLPESAQPLVESQWPRSVLEILDHNEVVLVDGASLQQPWHAQMSGESTLELVEVRSALVRARAQLAEPRLMASSFYQDGGWRVRIDGERVQTLVTSGLFVGAWLPAGTHQVELVYRPPGFFPGCFLSVGFLSIGVFWLVRARPRPNTTRRGG